MATTDARPLALFRIAVAAVGLVVLAGHARFLTEFFSDEGFLPRAELFASGVAANRFSLLDAFGAPWQVAAYLACAAMAFGALLVGYRTRAASFVAWLLLAGLAERNGFVFDGSDLLLRVLLFWLIFTDAGRVASVDALRSGRTELVANVPGLPLLLLRLQFLWMYASASLIKLAGPLWRDGTALHYAFSVPHVFTRDWATSLADASAVVRAATWGTIAFEGAFALLVLSPWLQPRLRTFAIAAGVAFHLGISAAMNIGSFPLVIFASYTLFLDPAWTQRPLEFLTRRMIAPIAQRLGPAGPRRSWAPLPRARRAALACFFGLVILDSLASSPLPWALRLPAWAAFPVNVTSMRQVWDMFAPEPILGDVWVRAEGELSDGTRVDPLRDAPGGPIAEHRRRWIYSRWTKVVSNLAFAPDDQIAPFGRWVCRRWNGGSNDGPLDEYRLIRVYRRTAPLGEPTRNYEERVLWTHRCRE